MTIKNQVEPTGTGQQGAGSPFSDKTSEHLHDHSDPVQEAANHAAKKGFERQQHEDPDIFTK